MQIESMSEPPPEKENTINGLMKSESGNDGLN